VVLLIACMHGVESRDGERGASSSVCLPILAGREKRYPSSLETPNCVRTEQTDRPLRWSLLYRSFSLMLIPIDRWLLGPSGARLYRRERRGFPERSTGGQLGVCYANTVDTRT
jgi:hypothetical protein